MLHARSLLDQPPRLSDGDGGGAPGPELVVGRIGPGVRQWRITAALELAGEDKPSPREIAGDDGAQDAHLAAIECLTSMFTAFDAAAPVPSLGDDVPDLPGQSTLVVEFAMRHASIAE